MDAPLNRATNAVKLIALLAIALTLASAASAQMPAANPLVVPALPPSPPAQLPAPISTAIAPAPLAVPSLPAAYSTPAPRIFNCTCSGPGQPTRWMGTVTAASYLAAGNGASGACASSQPGSSASNGTAGGIGAANFYGSLPGARQNADAARSFGVPGAASGSAQSGSQGVGAANSFGSPSTGIGGAQQQRACSNCVCD